jgi:hypothetical protein
MTMNFYRANPVEIYIYIPCICVYAIIGLCGLLFVYIYLNIVKVLSFITKIKASKISSKWETDILGC